MATTWQPTRFAQRLDVLVTRFWPGLALLDERARRQALVEVSSFFSSLPLALLGVAWLARSTDAAALARDWQVYVLLLIVSILLTFASFSQFVQLRTGQYNWIMADFQPLVSISALLLLGPNAIWLDIINEVVSGARNWRVSLTPLQRWNIARNRTFNIAVTSLGGLAALAIYHAAGGEIPLPSLAPGPFALALLATVLLFATQLAMLWLLILFSLTIGATDTIWRSVRENTRFYVFSLLPPYLFGILAAAIARQLGMGAYLFFMAAVFGVGLLARQLSSAAEQSMQRSAELGQLEALGRALLAAPPERDALPELLAQYVPDMFPYNQIDIWLNEPDGAADLLHTPADTTALVPAAWRGQLRSVQYLAIGARPPWDDTPATAPLVYAPILANEGGAHLGGIAVAITPQLQRPASAMPALQSLAAQISTALYRAEEYQRAMQFQRVEQELALAAQIQQSLLPAALPDLPGWQIAAALKPARQTSGDFYDVLELPGGRVGLLIADVADKGTGAALFMALSRTLIRTFAFEHPHDPAAVLRAANARMLSDAHSSMFVTAFYAVLDPASGRLDYANAGHNPPLWLAGSAPPALLRNTGIPLGILEEATWESRSITLAPGDTLLCYTDGVTEAENTNGAFFEEARLREVATPGQAADALVAGVLAAVQAFAGSAAQSDDITLLALTRSSAGD